MCVCVCVCVLREICSVSDSMIKICGNSDKSNT